MLFLSNVISSYFKCLLLTDFTLFYIVAKHHINHIQPNRRNKGKYLVCGVNPMDVQNGPVPIGLVHPSGRVPERPRALPQVCVNMHHTLAFVLGFCVFLVIAAFSSFPFALWVYMFLDLHHLAVAATVL